MSTAKRTKYTSSIGHSQYTSKIIKATAQLDDTKTLLEFWDEDASIEENFSRIREQNVFGKSSRSRVEDELKIFHQRYFFDLDVASALACLVKNNVANETLHPILFYFSAKADRLLYDTTRILRPMRCGDRRVSPSMK